MPARRSDRLLVAALAAASYALAFVQRPGLSVADTKIDLHVDPVRFLSEVASVWSPSTSLGHVQSGQYGGYLFPAGPFFAAGHLLGLPDWVVERLWLGSLWALAAWGMVRLLDPLIGRPRGVAHVVAAAAYVLNPYVLTYTSRVSVTLLAYALLPWLLLAVHRGLRDPRGWVWPAVAALAVTASGGGVNATVTAFVLVGPALLLLYELGLRMVAGRDAWGFAWRTTVLGVAVSLWWVLPLVVQSHYGLSFLPYTEQPGTIWSTTSVSESLRLMGFWLSYAGTGYGGRLVPYTTDAGVYLFQPLVEVATLLVPALALGGFAWTRRWRYGPFFLALVLVGVLLMFAGFPEGTPLRHALNFAYREIPGLDFLRTTYKAGPLVAVGLAALGGAGAGALWRARPGFPVRVGLAAGVAALLVLSSWPLWRGRAVDHQLTYRAVPGAWRAAATDLDRHLGQDARAMVLPGQLFAAYRWGETVDPILPSLTSKPVAVRAVVPFADLRAVDLQWTTDALVSQQRLLPGQLGPLLGLQAVGAVITGADDDRARSGAVDAADAARVLASAGGLGAPARAWGPRRLVAPGAGTLARPAVLPEVREYRTGDRGLVRVLPRDGGLVVDGSAGALAELAAFRRLPTGAPLRYAADLSPRALRAAVARGAGVVISDSNRRRVFVPSQLRGNFGPTLAPGDPISADGHQLDPWPARGTAAQTVAVLRGARYVRAPSSPQITQFPERRPYAAVDGDPSTAWIADRTLHADKWWLEVGLERTRDVPWIELLPYGDERGRVRSVAVDGRLFHVHPGWNRLAVALRHVSAVRVQMVDVTNPPAGQHGGSGGIRELRIPGVHISEALRPPLLAESALRGVSLRHTPLTYLFQRTTGDDPFDRQPLPGPQLQGGLVRDQGDGERGLERIFAPPAARRWRAQAWVQVAPAAADPVLDRLAGTATSGAALSSSSRYEGRPAWRASSAFDANPRTAWVGEWLAGRAAWIGWSLPAPRTIRTLRIVPAALPVRRVTRVRLVAGGGPGQVVAVGPGGRVALPAPVRARRFRLEIVGARFPPGLSGVQRQVRAVGIAELEGAGASARPAGASAPLHAGCLIRMTAGGRTLALRPLGDVGDLDAGRPLRAIPCGPAVALGAGAQRLSVPGDGAFLVDDLALSSPAPAGPAPLLGPQGGAVLSAGAGGGSSRDGVRVRVRGPAWLVLGQSYSRGWRASCDGRGLGAPVPIDGYANGWPVGRGCRDVAFAFAPQRLAVAGYLVSGVAGALALALLAVGLWRRRRRTSARPVLAALVAEPGRPAAPWALRRALAVGVAAGLVGGFVFALRAGVVIGPVVALLLWRGIPVRRLALAAGVLLGIVVPILYLAIPVENRGGYGMTLPLDRLAAHWVAVLAVVLLTVALVRELAATRPLRPPR